MYVYGPKNERPAKTVPLGQFVTERLKLFGDDVAQIANINGKEVTLRFSDILHRGRAVARVLTEHGLGVGDTVVLCCGNTLDYAPIFYGIILVGAACSPVEATYAPADFAHSLTIGLPQLVICSPEAEKNMREALTSSGYQAPLVTYDDLAQRLSDPENKNEFPTAHIPDLNNHVAVIMNSSGTTGKPKGVEITQGTMLSMADTHFFPRSVVALCVYPPIWVTSMALNLGFIVSGAKMVLLKDMDEQLFFESIQKYKVNFVTVGTQFLMVAAKWPSADKYDVSSVATLTCGGTKLTPPQLELAERRLGLKVTPTYGMTEALRVTKPTTRSDKPGSVGTLHENYIAKVIDLDTGSLLGPNQPGEMLFKGPSLMKGYRADPVASKAAFDEEGFFRSGDMGYFDEDGFFYVDGRIKDMIKYRPCLHLSACDIEAPLQNHPDIKDGVVLGVPHDEDTERAVAFIVKKPGSSVTAEDIVKYIQDTLPEDMWLHGGVCFVDEIPLTISGKVKRHVLRNTYIQNYLL